MSVTPGPEQALAPFFEVQAQEARFRALPPAAQARVLKLKSRFVLPQREFAQSAPRELVFLQFERWLSPAEKQELAALGVQLGEPHGAHAYLATLGPGAWERIKARAGTAAAAAACPEDKLSPTLYRMTQQSEALIRAAPDRRFRVAVLPAPGAAVPARELLNRAGRGSGPAGLDGSVLAELSLAEVMQFVQRPEVAYLSWAGATPEPHDNLSAAMHHVDALQASPYNLDGSGVRICIIDSGEVLETHEALTGRVTRVEPTKAYQNHSASMAGLMLANPPPAHLNAKGMAPAASLYSYVYDSDLDGGAPMEPSEKLLHSVTNYQCIISNNSWGYVGGYYSGSIVYPEDIFGAYDYYTRAWDLAVAATNAIVCKSSGNDRSQFRTAGTYTDPSTGLQFYYDGHDGTFCGDTYYDCISDWGCSKNVITLGALLADGTNLADYSSTGPANDGRIKPDLVADGDALLSTGALIYVNGQYVTSDTAYGTISGTSPSSAVTAGLCALVVQAWKNAHNQVCPDALVVKDLLIQTAVDLGRPGPDYLFGFGKINAQAAVDLLQADAASGPYIRQSSVADQAVHTCYVTVPVGTTSFRVTLTWLDPAAPEDALVALVNDLDLELVEPDGSTVRYPYSLDKDHPNLNATAAAKNSVDTVEQAEVANPTAGRWTVRVRGASVPQGPQSFVLASSLRFDAWPALASVSPGAGPPGGGTSVTLTGSGFTAGGTVTFGTSAASSVLVLSATHLTCLSPSHALGAVDVTVSGPDGQQDTKAGAFVYAEPPAISSLTPNVGTATGGLPVTFSGTGFATSGTVSVTFGGTPAAGVAVVSSTQLTCRTPAHATGTVSALVTNPDGQNASKSYTYVADLEGDVYPRVSLGDGHLNIFDVGQMRLFVSAAQTPQVGLEFQKADCYPVATGGDGKLDIFDVGVVRQLVSGGLPLTAAWGPIQPAPKLASLSPAHGPAAGGTSVTLTGTNFATGATVTFGGTLAGSVVVVSPTQITCLTPPGSAGAADVAVGHPDGPRSVKAAAFTYDPPPGGGAENAPPRVPIGDWRLEIGDCLRWRDAPRQSVALREVLDQTREPRSDQSLLRSSPGFSAATSVSVAGSPTLMRWLPGRALPPANGALDWPRLSACECQSPIPNLQSPISVFRSFAVYSPRRPV